MKRLFGKKKEVAPPPTLDDATGSLEKRGDGVDAKIKKLDLELARHREIIKKARPGPARDAAKRRALQVLKQKRLYENQREQLYNQQFNLEQVGFATQTAKETVVQVEAMRAANKELKTAFKSKAFDVDAIDDLNLEMADLMDQSNEISEMMGRNYNVPDDIDEEELMDELDALEDLMLEEEAVGAGEVPSYLREDDQALPDAPEGHAEALAAIGGEGGADGSPLPTRAETETAS